MPGYEIHPRLLLSEPMQRCKLHSCRAACCLYGVWIDKFEADVILQNADTIQGEMREAWRDPTGWFDDRKEEDEHSRSGIVFHSRVIDLSSHYGGSACIFLRQDHKCALQTAAHKKGLHPWKWKPFYCVLHPLFLDEKGRITLDDTDLLLDEAGSCLRPSKIKIPLLTTFEEELRYFLGDEEFERQRSLIP